MNLRSLVFPLALIGLLLWPTVYSQGCNDSVPEDVLLEAQFLPADAITAFPEAQLPGLLARESLEVQESIRASQAETMDTISDVISLVDYYHDVCPTYRYLLSYQWWYFYYNNQQLKCFSLQPLYITWCRTRYCNWNNNHLYYWWNRCVPEWRFQYFWAVCADVNGMWSIRYLKWRLPACCNCKRYWKYTLDQCAVSTTDLTGR